MRTIGIWANMNKKRVVELLTSITQWLESKNCNVLLSKEVASGLGKSSLGMGINELNKYADCLVVLGGDGTLLNCARMTAPYDIPLLGINFGHLGFLTEADIPDLYQSLERLIHDQFNIEERMMLEAKIKRNGNIIEEAIALNDVVLTKSGFARIIQLKTMVDGHFFTAYPADGLIIASPTGSTAYSLSAGGPLVVPNLDLMLITPICPHALWARPLVISSESQVEVILLSEQGQVMLTMDGQQGLKLNRGDSVIIKSSSYRAKFIKLNNQSFFNILREKLKQGDRND